jgi:TetR/AcrR family transcriptional repressor of nem operon
MENATKRWSSAAAASADPLQGIIDFYLSAGHRTEISEGCPLVALGSDAARQSADVRHPFEDGINAHLQILADLMPADDREQAVDKAMAAAALMVGAVTLSRIVIDKDLSDRLLDVAAAAVRRIATPEPRG